MLARFEFPRIGFEHLGFRCERVFCDSDIGASGYRQVPVGMPTLRQELSDCVFYLYGRSPKTGKITGPLGTGVVVSRYSRRVERSPLSDERPEFPDTMIHYYGVTNWHLPNQIGASIIRINTRDGGSRLLEFDPSEWQFIPGADDLSAIDLTDSLNVNDDQVAAYSETSFVTKEVIQKYRIALGEDAFMIGMFLDHHGAKRNHPVARFGNVALLANPDAPVKQPNGVARPSHLVDMRSRTGFSGSPVSVWRVPENFLLERTTWDKPLLVDNWTGHEGTLHWFTGLLGVHCGQFWDLTKARKSLPSSANLEAEQTGDFIREGDRLYVQSGMTIVVPAWAISELLDLEIFAMARKKRDAERIDEYVRTTPAPEAVEFDDSPAETGANPNHLEDFTRLVDVAARKRPQGD